MSGNAFISTADEEDANVSDLTPISEILVPVDFSECSRRALQYAMRIAAASNAHIHLLNVIDDPTLIDQSTDQKFRDRQAHKIEEQFLNVMSPDDRARFRTTTSIRFGTAYHEIETYAKEHDIELIVMGNSARSSLSSAILGSVSGHTIRHAVCPVMTVTNHC